MTKLYSDIKSKVLTLTGYEKYSSWTTTLSNFEKKLIWFYTYNSRVPNYDILKIKPHPNQLVNINTAIKKLKEMKLAPSHTKIEILKPNYLNRVQKLLYTAPIAKEDHIIFKGTTDHFRKFINKSLPKCSVNKIIDEVIDKKCMSPVRIDSLTSFTIEKSHLDNFTSKKCCMFTCIIKKGSIMPCVNDISAYPEEYEVLLPMHTRLCVSCKALDLKKRDHFLVEIQIPPKPVFVNYVTPKYTIFDPESIMDSKVYIPARGKELYKTIKSQKSKLVYFLNIVKYHDPGTYELIRNTGWTASMTYKFVMEEDMKIRLNDYFSTNDLFILAKCAYNFKGKKPKNKKPLVDYLLKHIKIQPTSKSSILSKPKSSILSKPKSKPDKCTQTKKSKCKSLDKLCNPNSGRCVTKNGKIGKQILAQSKPPSKPPSKSKSQFGIDNSNCIKLTKKDLIAISKLINVPVTQSMKKKDMCNMILNKTESMDSKEQDSVWYGILTQSICSKVKKDKLIVISESMNINVKGKTKKQLCNEILQIVEDNS